MSMPPKRPAAKSRPASVPKARATATKEVSPVRTVGRQSAASTAPRPQPRAGPIMSSPESEPEPKPSPPRSSPATSPTKSPPPPSESSPSPSAAEGAGSGEELAQTLSGMGRTMSETSIQTLQTLEELAKEMEDLERQTADIVHEDPTSPDVIGQLFGTVQKLLEHRIDAVSTMELTSGQQDARDGRKGLVKRANGLLDRLVQLRKQLAEQRKAEAE
eukprot:GGOE01053806.1.p1 GENE.GGOE01053806.1~~GGOE01053806.1.p1  ORF type:complete len:217 (+),score=44.33 GGOE01053806.1:82-732(+)